MGHWETIFEYLKGQGFSESLLFNQCIDPDDAAQLTRLIAERSPRRILEIGTFVGFSTGVIALSSPESSVRVCVDPNFPVRAQAAEFGNDEARGCLFFTRELLAHFGRLENTFILEGFFSRPLHEIFREQHRALGIGTEGIPVVGRQALGHGPFDLVFLDGDHYGESVASDLSLIHQGLAAGGVVVLHDVGGDWGEEVKSGVHSFLGGHGGYSFRTQNNLGYLVRES